MKYVLWPCTAVAVVLMAACAQQGGSHSAPAGKRLTPGQAHQLLVRVCKQTPSFQCVRKPFTVKLMRENTSEFERYFAPPVPVIQHAAITLFAGQTLHIEARPGTDGRLAHLRLVSRVTHPGSTLTLALEQVITGQGQNYMKLDVHNPFPEVLAYKAAINPLRLDGFRSAGPCSAGAAKTSHATWPEPLFKVRLTDLRLVDPRRKKAPAC